MSDTTNRIARPYPDNWPFSDLPEANADDYKSILRGLDIEDPEDGPSISLLAGAIRNVKHSLCSLTTVPAIFATDVEDGDIVVPLPCEDTCHANCNELLQTLRDMNKLPDAVWVPAYRKCEDETLAMRLAKEAEAGYAPGFFGVAYKERGLVIIGPVVAHPRFDFHTGDRIFADDNGDLTTEDTGKSVGVCLAPKSIYLNQYGQSLATALEDLHKQVINDIKDSFENPDFDSTKTEVLVDGTTTSRPLGDRFGDTVNVKDFGAVGDGVTDDSAAFAAAILYAQGLSSDVCLFLPAGTYAVTSVPSVPCYGPGCVQVAAKKYGPFELLFSLGGHIKRGNDGRYFVDIEIPEIPEIPEVPTDQDIANIAKATLEAMFPAGGYITVGPDGKIQIDFSSLDYTALQQIVSSIIAENGGITLAENGKLTFDFAQLTEAEKQALAAAVSSAVAALTTRVTTLEGKVIPATSTTAGLVYPGEGSSVGTDGKLNATDAWLSSATYESPRVIMHSGKLWLWKSASGPGVSAGAKEPGATGSEAYWTEFKSGMDIAPGGPDNYLVNTPQGLAVRGVQTAENMLWSKYANNTTLAGNIQLLPDYKNLVFGQLLPIADGNPLDPIVDVAADGTITILKDGVYHWRSKISDKNKGSKFWCIYFKKTGGTYSIVAEGSLFVADDNYPHVLIDYHGKLVAGDKLYIGVYTLTGNVVPSYVLLEFHRFADAALLAPALTTMGNEIVAAACGTPTSVIAYKSTPVLSGYGVYQILSSYFAFAPEPRSTPNWENFFEFVKEGDNYVGVKVKKDGVYHARLVVYIANNMNTTIGVGCAWTIVRDGAVINILDNLFNDSIEVNSGGASSVDGHVVLKAGDILWFCVVKEPITTFNITNIVLDVQRFADTLEHPNHGISQDAGNLAEVGSDLGVLVKNSNILTCRQLTAADNIDTLEPGIYYCRIGVAVQGTLPANFTSNIDDFLLVISEDKGTDHDIVQQRLYSTTACFYRDYYKENAVGSSWALIGAASPRSNEGSIGQWKPFFILSATPPSLPAGGVWAYFLVGYSSIVNVVDVLASVAAGGSAISPSPGAGAAASYIGFAWRLL